MEASEVLQSGACQHSPALHSEQNHSKTGTEVTNATHYFNNPFSSESILKTGNIDHGSTGLLRFAQQEHMCFVNHVEKAFDQVPWGFLFRVQQENGVLNLLL